MRTIAIFLFACMLVGISAAEPVKVIFDTDMYTDFDDAGALACLHALADVGECEILATVANTRDCMSVAMCEIINSYYGRPDIPVGCARNGGKCGASATHIKRYGATVEKYAKWVKHRNSSDAPDAVETYRRILAAQPDKSVVVCSVGFLNNLRYLLESLPDDISPMDGKALVAKKVKLWVAMACKYPSGGEYNSKTDPESSRIALENWPTSIVFSDYDYGKDCFAGRAVAELGDAGNPVADVFRAGLPSRAAIRKDPARHLRGGHGMGGRAAWDETAVLAAVRGIDPYFNAERGTYRMVGTDGANEWAPDAESGPHVRITEKMPKSEVARVIDGLMTHSPTPPPCVSGRSDSLLNQARCVKAAVLTHDSASHDSLADGFGNPPPLARSQVWWHWMNGNVTKEGITADLEAMAKAGIGGATIFDVTDHIPEGKVGFATDAWFGMLRHADAEARRLGLALCLANCSGWSTAGGPWVNPEDSMKRVVFTETPVKGGTQFKGVIPRYADSHGFYRDVALLAVPQTDAESINPVDYGMDVSATFTKDADKLAALRECRSIPKCCTIRRPKEGGKPNVATFTFERSFPLSGLVCSLKTPGRYMRTIVTLEVSVDGKTFRKIGKHKIYLRPFGSKNETDLFLPCPCTDAHAVRVTFDFPAGMAGVANKLQLLRPTAVGGIPEFRAKTFALRSEILDIPYEVRADQVVRLDDIVDLSESVKPDGTLNWTAPEGRDWRIFRFGYAAKGRTNHPATRLGVGLEVDKLSAASVERHFNAYIGRAADLIGPKTPFPQTGFNNVIVDSYEAGCPNWTDGFDAIFRERKGYDIVRYMPLFAGCIIDGKEKTERVLSDFRRVVSDLFVENFAVTFARLCHERGLYFSLEGYGNAPCDDMKYARWGDFTMAEFWAGTDSDPLKKGNSSFGGSVAHVWGGGKVVSAEAFTSGGDTRRWLKHPFAMKAQADLAWCSGVNQIVYHSYPHQPWLNKAAYPGMTMGGHGTHYGRTLTWWYQSGAWHGYQARVQFLLQQGVVCNDALVYNGDSAPNFGLDVERWHRYDKAEPLPRAYSWDVCGGDAIAAMRVRDGKIIVPSGASYSFLCVTDSPRAVSPESLADIERLKSEGALVFSGKPGEKVIAGAGIAPDVVCDRRDLTWIHRKADDGTDIYFLAMPNENEESFDVSFRIAGRIAELWNPATGERSLCRDVKDDGTRTTVPMVFDPFGSAFVLFRPEPTPGIAVARRWCKLGETVVEGEWNVEFIDGRGAPEKAVFDRLVSWTDRPEDGIRHYSGSAVYSKTIVVPSSGRTVLDLGEVKEVVDVTVNGKTYPTLWKPPFRLDITDAVKGRAEARLSLKVTNLWPNRLIGDDALSPDAEYRPDGSLGEIPAWVWEGKSSPSGRNAFATWRHWRREDGLLPSGLVGPVKIETGCLED